MRLRLLAAAFVMLCFSVIAKADTITLNTASSSNGTYNYDFTQNDSTDYENFQQGSSFTLSGLSGITGASVAYSGFFTTTFTSTSATFAFNTFTSVGPGTYTNFFTLTSTVLTTGLGSFSIPTTPAQTGIVGGPVSVATAATPEPSSLALLGTGILGAIGAARRRFVA